MSNNNYIKGTLARLLAEENMLIRYEPRKGATFDYKKRILTLPTLVEDINNETYNLIIGREAARALYSQDITARLSNIYNMIAPGKQEWGKTLYDIADGIRTERLVKKKYPGLANDFNSAYKQMYDAVTHGMSDPFDPQTCSFVDRLSAYFRLGGDSSIKFDKGEKNVLKLFEDMKTHDDAVEAAKVLRKYVDEPPPQVGGGGEGDSDEDDPSEGEGTGKSSKSKSNKDKDKDDKGDGKGKSKSKDKDDSDGDGDGDSKGEGKDGESDDKSDSGNGDSDGKGDSGEGDSDGDGDGDGEGDSDEGNDDQGKASNAKPNSPGGKGQESNQNPQFAKSDLSDALGKLMGSKVDTNAQKFNFVLFPEKLDPDEFIVPYKTVHEEMRGKNNFGTVNIGTMNSGSAYTNLKSWTEINNPTTLVMINEFERRKRAALYRRQKTAKTGMLDTNRLQHAMYSDDVFRKVTVLPEGKNHGFVMIIDWSGSMSSEMAGTIDQVMNLVSFSRRRKIPHEVYAFSDACHFKTSTTFNNLKNQNVPGSMWPTSVKLIQFFSDQMSQIEYNQAMENMNELRLYYSGKKQIYGYNSQPKISINMRGLQLGGTPLNSAILITSFLIERMRERTKAEILKTIILTDGESNGEIRTIEQNNYSYGQHSDMATTLADRKTGFNRNTQTGISFTGSLIELSAKRANCDYVGIYVVGSHYGNSKKDLDNLIDRLKADESGNYRSSYARKKNLDSAKQFNQMKKDGFVVVESFGFSEYYLLNPSGPTLIQNAPKFEDLSANLKTMVEKKKVNRALLARFIQNLAV